MNVVFRMIADDVHDRSARSPGVVQVGDAVGKAWPQVQQGQRRDPRHAGISVRRPGDDILLKTENRAHAGHRVQGVDYRYLGGPGIGKHGVDAGIDCCLD